MVILQLFLFLWLWDSFSIVFRWNRFFLLDNNRLFFLLRDGLLWLFFMIGLILTVTIICYNKIKPLFLYNTSVGLLLFLYFQVGFIRCVFYCLSSIDWSSQIFQQGWIILWVNLMILIRLAVRSYWLTSVAMLCRQRHWCGGWEQISYTL